MGGLSAEREISLQSGQAVLAALLANDIDAIGLDVGEDAMNQIQQANCDRAFIALHGRGGEDGVMQGALEMLGIPYTGSGVLGSAISMDKLRTKQIWQAMGLPTPACKVLTANSDWAAIVDELGLPLIVKPVHEGSSVGMSKVDSVAELQDAYTVAAEYDNEVFAERWITGKEYTTAILLDEVLPMIRLATPNQFYDYDAKYLSNTTEYLCPCGLDSEVESALQQLSRQAFKAVSAHGWGRVDLMLDEEQQPWLIEVNTVPGMTDHSLVPMAAKAADISFKELVKRILQTSM